MKRLVAFLLAPLSLLLVPPQDSLAFAPHDGASVAKQFDFELEFSKTTVALDGGYAFEYFPKVRLATSVQLTDTYTKSGGGRPLDLLRIFGKLSGKWFLDDVPKDILGFWSLSYHAVRFEWDPVTACYTRTLQQGSGVDLPIHDMAEDADLRGLLPREPVKPGEKWTAKGQPVIDALFGTTEMGLLGAPAHTNEGFLRDTALIPFRALGVKELTVECTSGGKRDAEHPELASIGLKIDQKFELDLAGAANDFVLATFGSMLVEFEVFQARWEVAGPGRLVWNTEAGRFETFELALAVNLTCDARLIVNRQPMHIGLASKGTAKWSYSARPD